MLKFLQKSDSTTYMIYYSNNNNHVSQLHTRLFSNRIITNYGYCVQENATK